MIKLFTIDLSANSYKFSIKQGLDYRNVSGKSVPDVFIPPETGLASLGSL